MWRLDSEEMDGCIGRLSLLGLTRNEAMLYLTLAATTEDTAGVLAKKTGINRIDTYRLLKKLAEKGLLNLVLGRPTKYRVVEAGTALRNLYGQKETSLIAIREQIIPLVQTIEKLGEKSGKVHDAEFVHGRLYTLAYGRSSYLSDVTRMTEGTLRTLCIVMTQNAMKRAFSRNTPDLWATKSFEGVEIKMIVDRNSITAREIRALSQNVEVRSAPNAMMRLTIFDDSSTLLCATDDVDLSVSSPFDVYLKTNDEKFSKVMRLLFDHMWRNAKPIKR